VTDPVRSRGTGDVRGGSKPRTSPGFLALARWSMQGHDRGMSGQAAVPRRERTRLWRPIVSESVPTPRPGAVARLRRRSKAALLSGPRRDRWQQPRRVIDALGIEQGMRAADIGSGGGYFTMRLARAVGAEGYVYAVDTDADLRSLVADRAAARDLTNVTTVAPPQHAPGLPEPVDLAIIVNAFHHLPDPPDYLRALVEQHLAPNARVAVIEAVPRWWLLGHATEPAVIRAALEDAGLTIEAEHHFLRRQSFQVARGTN
jgi:SAM-dependent methyltransferase